MLRQGTCLTCSWRNAFGPNIRYLRWVVEAASADHREALVSTGGTLTLLGLLCQQQPALAARLLSQRFDRTLSLAHGLQLVLGGSRQAVAGLVLDAPALLTARGARGVWVLRMLRDQFPRLFTSAELLGMVQANPSLLMLTHSQAQGAVKGLRAAVDEVAPDPAAAAPDGAGGAAAAVPDGASGAAAAVPSGGAATAAPGSAGSSEPSRQELLAAIKAALLRSPRLLASPHVRNLPGVLLALRQLEGSWEGAAELLAERPTLMCTPGPRLCEMGAWLRAELSLEQQAVWQIVRRWPLALRVQPSMAQAALHTLCAELGLSRAEAVQHVLRCPSTLLLNPDRLAGAMQELERLLGGREAAVAVLRTRPGVCATLSADHVRQFEQHMLPLLCPKADRETQQAMCRRLLGREPGLLTLNFSSPAFAKKFAWIQEHGWQPVEVLGDINILSSRLERLAARLGFVRSLGALAAQAISLSTLARDTQRLFFVRISRALGREVSAEEFEEWRAAWLASPEGAKWGTASAQHPPPVHPELRQG